METFVHFVHLLDAFTQRDLDLRVTGLGPTCRDPALLPVTEREDSDLNGRRSVLHFAVTKTTSTERTGLACFHQHEREAAPSLLSCSSSVLLSPHALQVALVVSTNSV